MVNEDVLMSDSRHRPKSSLDSSDWGTDGEWDQREWCSDVLIDHREGESQPCARCVAEEYQVVFHRPREHHDDSGWTGLYFPRGDL